MTPERRGSLLTARLHRRLILAAALTLGLAAPGAAAGTAAAAPGTAAATTSANAAPAARPAVTRITLVTGDRVELVTRNGRQDAVVLPEATGARPSAVVQRRGGHVHVIPTKARALLAAGKLDPRLFDVTQLAADGATGAGRLPVLVAAGTSALAATPKAGTRTGTRTATTPPVAPAGSRARRTLPQLGVTAVAVTDAGRFWDAVTTGAPAAAAAPSTAAAPAAGDDLAPGIGKLWLDGRVRATLDRSVPQIGGPAARARGLDGRGVTVAVLDSGIDDQNADVAPRVTQDADFSGEGDTDDHFGHGTHVASIIAGTGANSGGRYAGVAPAASLIDGKVLNDYGFGHDSGVLAGMEWAAPKARVVNMSLGGGVTDGTDPVAQAVDTLTAQYGTLFVVAAGNEGDGGDVSTVDTPGSATSALTVGAVDRDDTLADFSSRGPRLGGSLIKPEITAPGVEIVAAQADGTELGPVVAPGYVALSGTSMATPHVAGSAALVAQQHAGWKADALKARLVTTAAPHEGTSIWSQGAGRVDLATATADRLRVDAGTLDLGFFAYPHGGDAPVIRQLTYTNDGAAPVAVAVGLTLADDEGTAAPASAVAVDTPSFTLAAGASRTVSVTATPDALAIGRWSGAVTATTSAGPVRTVIGLVKEPERYTVDVDLLDRAGAETQDAIVEILDEDTGRFYDLFDPSQDLRLPPGTYLMSAWELGASDDAAEIVLVTRFDVRVTADARVTLDARGSVPYSPSVQAPDAVPSINSLGYSFTTASGDGLSSSFTLIEPGPQDRLWARPTSRPRTGTYEFDSTASFQPPTLAASVEGGTPALTPLAVWQDERLEGRHTVDVVRSSTPAKGAYVLLQVPEGTTPDDAVAAAAKSGAAGAIVALDENFTGFSSLPAVPTFALRLDQWTALADVAASSSVPVTVTGTLYPSYTYNLAQVTAGRIPESLTYRYRDADLARVTRTFQSHGQGGTGQTFMFPMIPAGGFAAGQGFRHGSRRTDLLSPGLGWETLAEAFLMAPNEFGFRNGRATWDTSRTFGQGRASETWAGELTGPALPSGDSGVSRYGDEVFGVLVPWTDAAGHAAWQGPADTVRWSLSTGGVTVAEGQDGFVLAQLPAGRRDYVLDLTGHREAGDGWALSSDVSARWTFRSATTDAEQGAALPLLSLDAVLPLDIANSAPRGRATTFTVTGRMPAGVAARRVQSLVVESSADGGTTWAPARVTRSGPATFTVTVVNPNHAGTVSLRMTAAAGDGIGVHQEVRDAYRLR